MILSSFNQDKQHVLHGVYNGIVTDNKDPKSYGRVKVKIPIIDNTKEFDWMRTASLVAGNEKGMMFVPEVGDEVLVAFLMGDIQSPIVIGCLWKEKQLPDGFTEKNDIKKIKTRLGHEIIFNDDSKNGEIMIKTNKGHKVQLSEKNDEIIVASSKGEQKITLSEQSGEVEIKSSTATIKLMKTGEVKINGSKGISVQGSQIKIEATGTLDLKANANMSLQTNGVMQIKGSIIKLN